MQSEDFFLSRGSVWGYLGHLEGGRLGYRGFTPRNLLCSSETVGPKRYWTESA